MMIKCEDYIGCQGCPFLNNKSECALGILKGGAE